MSHSIPVTAQENLKPGQMSCFEVEGQRIIVAYIDDKYYAFDEMCSHEDAPLWRGALRSDHVECPLHGSRFCLQTGKPMEEPATEAIKTYPIQIINNTIHICL